jgi:hypothetical protein
MKRRRFKHVLSLRDRLVEHAKAAREQAKKLSLGKEGESLLRRARQCEAASDIDAWLSSPCVSAPR